MDLGGCDELGVLGWVDVTGGKALGWVEVGGCEWVVTTSFPVGYIEFVKFILRVYEGGER